MSIITLPPLRPTSLIVCVFSILVLTTVLPSCTAHTNFLKPLPYNYAYNQGVFPDGCAEADQCLACPKKKYYEEENMNSEEEPAETWTRGQNVTVSWARNNHAGGIIRISFVRPDQMWDKDIQEKHAFYYGCWEQNYHECQEANCGRDKNGTAWKRQLTVPDHVPDGVFVMALTWFGGLEVTGQTSRHPDYNSCSYIRISGGSPVAESFQPYFSNELPFRNVDAEGKCNTAFDKPGRCLQKMECEGLQPEFQFPAQFKNGAKPLPVLSSWLEDTSVFPKITPTPISQQSQSPTPTPTLNDNHVCTGKFCCPEYCGRCTKLRCNRAQRWDLCCPLAIEESGRKCSEVVPPCKKD